MRKTDNLGYIIHHISSALDRQSDQVLQERLGIGFAQLKLMMVLQEKTNIQQKEIAGCLGQTEASISRQIKIMQDKGFLLRRVSPNSKREHLIVLSVKGQRFFDEAMTVLEELHKPIYSDFSDKELAQLRTTLSIIHKKVCCDTKTQCM